MEHAATHGADSGLRCPKCEYNLTGLPAPRCPECGAEFTWAEARAALELRPTIAFERAKSWHKAPAFAVTWLTVMFAPWVFARQAVRRMHALHAIVFVGVCFAGVVGTCVYHSSYDLLIAWLLTATAYIVLQTVLLSLLDPRIARAPLGCLGFWLLAGCYTSAVMLAEVQYGPPLVQVVEMPDFLLSPFLDRPFFHDNALNYRHAFGFEPRVIMPWSNLLLWTISVACIVFARTSGLLVSALRRWVTTVCVLVALPFAYAAAVEFIGFGLTYPFAQWVLELF